MASRNAGNVSVRFSVENAETVRRALQDLGKDGEKALRQLDDSGRPASHALRLVSAAGADAQGYLRAAAASAGPLAGSLSALGAAGLVASGAIGLLSVGAAQAVQAFGKFEEQSAILQNVLNATGHAAGLTAEQIEALAGEIGDIANVRAAAAQLLTFRSVAGETFERALKLADDLAAVGFGNVQSAALMLGKALENPTQGLTALGRAGVTFSERQKSVIRDLYETGRVAEAQKLILDEVQRQVGGSGAAQDRGLTGAYEALSDATTRLLERWGAQIVRATGLTEAIRGIAGAIDEVNKKASDPALEISANIERYRAALAGLEGMPGGIAAQSRRRFTALLNEELEKQLRLQQAIDAQADTAAYGQAAAERARAIEQYEAVTAEIEKEREALKKSELQKAIDANLRKAGVTAASEQGREIVRLTTLHMEEKEAQEKANAAKREAEALTKRQAEQVRKLTEQQQSRMRMLEVERSTIGLSEQAALALKTAEEELSKLREKNIPINATLLAQIQSYAHRYASLSVEVERMRKLYDDLNKLGLDTVKGFLSDFRRELANGASAWEAFQKAGMNALNRIADKLLEMAIDNLWKNAFGGGGGMGLLGLLLGLGGGRGGGVGIGTTHTGLWAMGGAFEHGRVTAYARGGLVDRPTLFPLATGAGLMGEAGPEAIMPLRRGPDGRLGVSMHGGGARQVIEQHIHVSGIGDQDLIAKTRQAAAEGARQAAQAELRQYDQMILPTRINEIAADPRFRG